MLFGVIFAAYKSLIFRKSPNERTGHPVETHKTSESRQKTMDHRLVCVLCMYWVDIHEIYFVRILLHFSLTNQIRSMEKFKWIIAIWSNSNVNQWMKTNRYLNWSLIKILYFYDVPIEIHMVIVRNVPSQATLDPNWSCFTSFINHYYTNTLIFC